MHSRGTVNLSTGINGSFLFTGEVLGNAIAENTGMKELNLSWNCFREMGSIPIAKGLGVPLFIPNGFSSPVIRSHTHSQLCENVL